MTVHPSIPATHDYYCKYTNKPSVMPNKFGITEREYIGRSQIYEEYSVKKIAKVDRRSFPLSESLRSLTTLTTLKSLKPPRSCRGAWKAARVPLAVIVMPATARRHVARQGIIFV